MPVRWGQTTAPEPQQHPHRIQVGPLSLTGLASLICLWAITNLALSLRNGGTLGQSMDVAHWMAEKFTGLPRAEVIWLCKQAKVSGQRVAC